MGQSLSTTVNGSSGECVEAADALGRLYRGMHRATDTVRAARGTGDATWHGPAHDEFNDAIRGLEPDLTTISDKARAMERALRDFADSLDAVEKKMADALGKAHSGGLVVDGPYIVSPSPPAAPEVLPTGPCGTQRAASVMERNQQAISAHNAAVGDYNAKQAVYNECKAIVEQARTTEKNAHDALQQVVGTVDEGVAEMTNLAPTVLARTLGYIGTMENTRRAETYQAERALTRAQFFDDYAHGKLANATPAQLVELAKAARKARFDAWKHVKRAEQFDLWIKTEPEATRKAVVAYPGKNNLDDLPKHVSEGTKAGQKVLRSMPFLGSALTAGTEIVGAATGEQSWGKAAADTAGNIGGGALGAAGAGALAGSTFGPLGTLIVGTAGGIVGAIGGQAVSDFFVPE